MMQGPSSPNPFHDLRVVEVGSFIAAAWAARVLGDFGADVIKVEAPGGDLSRRYGPFPPDRPNDEGASGLFHYLNTNKRGITLNLDEDSAGTALRTFLADADVLIVDLPLRDQERWRLTFDNDLRETNPRLIVASITPFGMSGPYRYRRAYDINIAAASGLAFGLGRPDETPLNFPLFQVLFQGGLAAAAACLVALIARGDQHAAGQQVEVAIEEMLATQHSGRALPTFLYRGITGKRSGSEASYFGRYPSGNRSCADGQVTLSAPQLDQWIRFVKAMGTPTWTEEPRYRDRRAMQTEYREEVDALVQPWLDGHTRADLLQIALDNHIPLAPVFKGSEVLANEHFKERDAFFDMSSDQSGWMAPKPSYRMSRIPFEMRRPAPGLGEHNAEVLGAASWPRMEEMGTAR